MNRERLSISISVFCVGVSALVTQILVLREFFNVFAGNELILGLVMGSWLLIAGVGALIGGRVARSRNRLGWLGLAQGIIALLPLAMIAGIRLSKGIFLPGLAPGLGATFGTALVVLLPYCLLAGGGLVLAAALLGEESEAVGRAYVLDTAGSIAGGLLFSFVLVFAFTPVQTAGLLLVLNLGAAVWLAWSHGKKGIGGALVGGLVICLAFLRGTDIEGITARLLFPGLELIHQEATPYGYLAIVRQGEQLTAFENGQPVGATDDRLAAEEMVHFALSQHPAPRQVLLIGGGLQGGVAEVEKYAVERIDYVEPDPALIGLGERLGVLGNDERVRAIAMDSRLFVKRARGAYDAVLVDLPPPATAQLNRFYTVEFFAEVRDALRAGGVFSLGIGGAENYADPGARLLAASVYRSLKSVFAHVLVIPGERLRLVAAERALDPDIAGLLASSGVKTRYVNADYLEARLAPDRMEQVREMVAAPAPLNRDFAPAGYQAHLRHWLDQFGGGLLLPLLLVAAVALILATLLASAAQRPVAAAIGASGFAGMGLEVVLLLGFQVCFGHVYRHLSLIVTAFMIGSAGGAAWANRRSGDDRRRLLHLDAALGLGALMLAPILAGISGVDAVRLGAWAPPLIFALLTGAVGFLVGAQLPVAARLIFRGVGATAGQLFGLDLLGACVGALTVAALCIPIFGLEVTCYLIGGLKLATAGWLLRWRAAPEVERQLASGPRVLSFGVVLFAFAALGALIAAPDTGRALYDFTFAPAYHGLLLVLAGWGILQAMGIRFHTGSEPQKKLRELARWIYDHTRIRPLRWLFFAAFAPVVFYPIFRCYFKVPFLFCHVCPRLCVFGYLRPYLVPAALVMNLEKRHWCHHACPLGTLYQCQAGTGVKRRLGKWLFALPLGVLAFVAIGYFEIRRDLEGVGAWPGNWYALFFKETFSVSGAVIAVAAILLVMGFRWRRSFCDTLCPVGTFSELLQKIERRLTSRKNRAAQEVAHG